MPSTRSGSTGSSSPAGATPRLTVLILARGRADAGRRLLNDLEIQTLAPSEFEVLLVDEGSGPPDAAERPYSLVTCAGVGARAHALELCRAPSVLLLEETARPAPDLLERHLAVRETAPLHSVSLGALTSSSAATPFRQILAGIDGEHGRGDFRANNVCLATADLDRAGGLGAESLREAMDADLGNRLDATGLHGVVVEDARCEDDHAPRPREYFAIQQRLGASLARLYEERRDPRLLQFPADQPPGPNHFAAMQQHCESHHGTLIQLLGKLEELDGEHAAETLPEELLTRLRPLIVQLRLVSLYRGILSVFERNDPGTVIEAGPPPGRLTSIVVLSHQDLDRTRRCLAALRASAEADHPMEILVVDNGSTDGSAAWLSEQDDITAILNDRNVGAPAARNQALARARGEWIVFMDNDAMVTPGWLPRLLHHGEVDARSGCIGPVSDRAAHGQQIEAGCGSDPDDLRRFADGRARSHARQFRFTTTLTSFCVLVRREVIDAIGGFDERFSPWGFEDDDFTLRAALAGFRNRLAQDVFVRHESYDGPKLDRHSQLLLRNWRRFSSKWGAPEGAAYGDYSTLDVDRAWARSDLYVPFEGSDPTPAPLPGAKADTLRAAGGEKHA